jgi:hypothetical protein
MKYTVNTQEKRIYIGYATEFSSKEIAEIEQKFPGFVIAAHPYEMTYTPVMWPTYSTYEAPIVTYTT